MRKHWYQKVSRFMMMALAIGILLSENIYAQSGGVLSDRQIQILKENLKVPDSVAVTEYYAESPVYWEGAGLWIMQVYLYSNGTVIASASVDPNTMELYRNIQVYEPPTQTPEKPPIVDDEAILEAKVQEIRDIYYDTESRMSTFTYVTDSAGRTWYYYGKGLKKISVPAGTYDAEKYEGADRYSAEFYYDLDCTVRFVYVFDGTEEYRYYIEGTNDVGCIRAIDNMGYTYNYYQKKSFSDLPGPGYFCSLALIEPHWAGLV